MKNLQKLFPLKGKVQHYAWGGYRFIPDLIGEKNTDNKPFAEYWMGAHEQVPSEISFEGKNYPLSQWIAEDAEHILGAPVAKQFGRLPFLFKVLDVKDMLSIQVHPTREEAIKGFAREQAAGIPISDPSRNYKDDNHKPEVMVALSDFWLLHGFRRKEEIRKELERQPSWHALLPILEKEGIRGLYETVMNQPQEETDRYLAPLAVEVLPLYRQNLLSKGDPAFWAARAIEQYSNGQPEKLDKGIFSIYFFNLVHLKPGQAIFQGAGIPHAYLEGQNMELMANSDNVLRGGLTPKHIDVPELIKHTSFEEVVPKIMEPKPDASGEILYPCPVPDFAIRRVVLGKGMSQVHHAGSAEVVFVFDGSLTAQAGEKDLLNASRGQAFFVSAGTDYRISSGEAADCFIASAGTLG